jgi:hypothetical protein
MSQPKSTAETVAGARGRVQEPIVRYKRVVISRLGGPEVLEVREEELPEPGLVVGVRAPVWAGLWMTLDILNCCPFRY